MKIFELGGGGCSEFLFFRSVNLFANDCNCNLGSGARGWQCSTWTSFLCHFSTCSLLCLYLRIADDLSDSVFAGSGHSLESPGTMEQVNARELGCINVYVHSREMVCRYLAFYYDHKWLISVLMQGVDRPFVGVPAKSTGSIHNHTFYV